MKRAFIGLVTLLAIGGAAHANCSTASLAGKWVVMLSGVGSACVATVSSAGTITGGCGNGKVTMTTACVGTVTLGGTRYSGRSESIAPSSPLKPNLVMGSYTGGQFMWAYRQ